MSRNGGRSRTVAAVLFAILLPVYAALSQPGNSAVFVEGEDLVYNVRYGMFDLGQVRIKTLKKITANGTEAFETIAYIDSYKNIPFVKLHAIFESLVDASVFSHRFIGKSQDGEFWNFARYRFDYDGGFVYMDSGRKDTIVERRDTLKLQGRVQDGLSLFFFAREQLLSRQKVNVPAIVKEKRVNTYIDFHGKRRSHEYDFVDYPVDVIGFEGNAEFTGIFGLTGGFEGWFSNDNARVPIMAKMKVILGNVTVELMRWTRSGWQPPRGE